MRTIAKRLPDCQFRQELTKKSKSGKDRSNGYFLVGERGKRGSWGTSFLRIVSNPDHQNQIKIFRSESPNFFHTYTKIPRSICENVFHVYINYPKDCIVGIFSQPGMRVIGFDTPQPSGDYLNRSFLIYCPSGEEPNFYCQNDGFLKGEGFFLDNLSSDDEPIWFDSEFMFRGKDHQMMVLNDGLYHKPAKAIL